MNRLACRGGESGRPELDVIADVDAWTSTSERGAKPTAQRGRLP
jgi:hypothetical protein